MGTIPHLFSKFTLVKREKERESEWERKKDIETAHKRMNQTLRGAAHGTDSPSSIYNNVSYTCVPLEV